MNISQLMSLGIQNKASDIHLLAKSPIILRIDGELVFLNNYIVGESEFKSIVEDIFDEDLNQILSIDGEVDTIYHNDQVGRGRISVFKQNNGYGMTIRIIPLQVPSADSLGLPKIIQQLTRLKRGLILVTGTAGSGKSTTLASMIDIINRKRNCHILTLEDPIEYVHENIRSIISQRQIGRDTNSFKTGLISGLRQDPDVILLGEMRNLDTISTALTAAETGHLVLSTLHTLDASKSVDRIIDVFPSHQQNQIRIQLSGVIQAIISQQLLPRVGDKGRIAAYEIMVATDAIRNLIREGKTHQINSCIQTGKNRGMQTMDSQILELLNRKLITEEVASCHWINKSSVEKHII